MASFQTEEDIHCVFREALAAHEAFQRLGFKPDDLYCVRNPDGAMFVVLKAQEREFAVEVGNPRMEASIWQEEWTRVARAVSSGVVPEPVLQDVYKHSMVYEHAQAFTEALLKKGFALPRLQN